MLLSTWIDRNGGSGKTGKILGVDRTLVYSWKKGICMPRPAAMKTIVKVSRGKVSYAEIIDEGLAKTAKPKTITKAKGKLKKKPLKKKAAKAGF